MEVIVNIAELQDAKGIHNTLKANLIEVRDVDEIPEEQRKYLEDHGFLRKEVEIDYYKKLIQDPNCDIYVAKNNNGDIIGFASIHKHKYDIRKVRSVLDNIHSNDEKTKELLINENKEFAYLDQISILPDFKRKKVGTLIMNKILDDMAVPIVAFIVEVPLTNIASARWHKYNGFDLTATSDGSYKGKKFQFWVYIHWNKR